MKTNVFDLDFFFTLNDLSDQCWSDNPSVGGNFEGVLSVAFLTEGLFARQPTTCQFLISGKLQSMNIKISFKTTVLPGRITSNNHCWIPVSLFAFLLRILFCIGISALLVVDSLLRRFHLYPLSIAQTCLFFCFPFLLQNICLFN